MLRNHAAIGIDIGGVLLRLNHLGIHRHRMQSGAGIDKDQDFLGQAGDARLRLCHLIGMCQPGALSIISSSSNSKQAHQLFYVQPTWLSSSPEV